MVDGRERRQVAATRVKVSRLGVGGGSLANTQGEQGIRTLLDGCWNAGLRYFDTAPLYVAGESERRFGAGLGARPRDQYVLSTKLGRFVQDGREVFDYTAEGAEASVERSMSRLGVDRLDIVFIHDLTPKHHEENYERQFRTAMEGAYPFLAGLRSKGVIGAVGVAMAFPEVCLRFAKEGQFDCFMLAGAYTLLQHASLDTLLPYCESAGSSVMIAAPFNTGILATGAIEGARFEYMPASRDILTRTEPIVAICRHRGISLQAAALQFPLAHPAVVSAVVGNQSMAEVAANLKLLAEPIPEGMWQELKGAGLLPAHAPVPQAHATPASAPGGISAP